MRLADAMLELTCPAQTDVARSLTSEARAAPACVSAISSKKPSWSWPTARSQKASSSSGRRTGASPQTVSVMAALRRHASRRLGSGSAASSSRSTLQSTMGSSACGRSYCSTEASAISAGVVTPHRCRHGSPRCERFFISTRSCSLICRPSARLLAGVAYGSRLRSSDSSESSAQLSKSLCGVKPAPRAAACRAAAMSLAMAAPASICDVLTTSLARSTMTPRAMPVSVESSEPSEAPRAARCLIVSKTRVSWWREWKRMRPDCSACRWAAASMMPGSKLVCPSRGVVLRTARLHTATVWLAVPSSGWQCLGAHLHACSVVLLASFGLRMAPTCSCTRLLASRQRQTRILGTRASVVTTKLEMASADLMALRLEMSTSSAL